MSTATARATDSEIAEVRKEIDKSKIRLSIVDTELEKTKIEISLVTAEIKNLEKLYARTPLPKYKRALDQAYFEFGVLNQQFIRLESEHVSLLEYIRILEAKLLELLRDKP
ncbi:MAG: hypothetical protein IPK83_23515 [Planctomycetes bacterium]|nr:hypothetical protein [Planctomycetota bacterium]